MVEQRRFRTFAARLLPGSVGQEVGSYSETRRLFADRNRAEADALGLEDDAALGEVVLDRRQVREQETGLLLAAAGVGLRSYND